MKRISCCALAVLALTAAGCSKTTAPTTAGRLMGAAIVRADLRDSTGLPQGTQDFPTVSGLRVQLMSDSVVVRSGVTRAGQFAFDLVSGVKAAVAFVGDEPVDSVQATSVVNERDVVYDDPLVFGTHGDVAIAPNPLGAGTGWIGFGTPRQDTVRLEIADMTGAVVKVLGTWVVPIGGVSYFWDGKGSNGRPVPPGLYWIIADRRATLAGPAPRPGTKVFDIPPIIQPQDPEVMCTVLVKQ